MTGTKKMPPPMTLEMTIAAASSGPRRRCEMLVRRKAAPTYWARTWRGMSNVPISTHCDALCLAKMCTRTSWNAECFRMSARDCGGSPV